VEFDRPSGSVVAETEDISNRGMFVRTEALLPVGEETDLRLSLPGGAVIGLFVRVAHMLTPSAAHALGRHAGMGFEIVGDDSPARLRLRAHLDSVKTETTSPGLSTTTQVIVIEPSPPLRARMTRSLDAAGFKVTAVSSATEALEACAVWRPDAIISAGSMEGMTGIDLAYAMSEHTTLADVPLILTAEDPSDLSRLEAYRAGVRDYIPRPFIDEELVIRVHRVAAPATGGGNQGLRGSLVDIGLGTLLSLFEFDRKSGILLVLRSGDVARLFVSEGRILKVEVSGASGDARARLMTLLDWHEGQFEFSPCAIGGRDEVGAKVTQLLLEHAHSRDEALQGS
jgi:CheY-like chemotaxis protein